MVAYPLRLQNYPQASSQVDQCVDFLFSVNNLVLRPSLVPTPFASHAFHPLDGYLQGVPYHLFVFLFPIHRVLYLVLFILVNFWTIFVSLAMHYSAFKSPNRAFQIHDSDMITGHIFEKAINGPAHHTLHHIYFNVNYGQVSYLHLFA